MGDFEGTEGEWLFKVFTSHKITSRIVVVSSNGDIVYRMLRDDNDNSSIEQANAQLICAAPALLEACIEFCRKVECGEAISIKSYTQMKIAIDKALNG